MAILTVLVGAAAAPAWSQPPLADKVPAETLVYVGWAGPSLSFKGSLFGQLVTDPDIKRVIGAIRSAASDRLADKEDKRAVFDHLWAMGKIAWQHPAAVAVLDIVPPPVLEGESGRGRPQLVGALLIALQKDKAAFEGELQGLLAVAGKKIEITRATLGEVSYHRFDTARGPCGLGFVGELFFVSLGENTPHTIAALAGGKAKSLAANPEFAAAMKQVCGETVQLAYYVNAAGSYEAIDKLNASPAATAPAGESKFRRAIKAMGVDRVTAVASAANIVDRGIHQKTRVLSAGPRHGLLSLLSGPALTAEAPAGVPADADLVVAFRTDPEKLLPQLKNVLAAFRPAAGEKIDAALAEANKHLGLDIEKDVLAHLGDEWTLYSAESLGGFLTGTVLSVTVKDEAKLRAALTGPDESDAGATTKPARPAVRSLKYGELEVHCIERPKGSPLPLAPAWAVHKGRLYVGAFPQVVVAAALGTSEKPLAESPAFIALRKRLAASSSHLVYVNSPQVLRRFYGLGLVGWTATVNALAGRRPAVSCDMLPPLPTLEKYVRPDIAVVTADAEGITFESYGSLPGGSGMLVLSPLRAAAGRARLLARRARWITDLKSMAEALELHRKKIEDKKPPVPPP